MPRRTATAAAAAIAVTDAKDDADDVSITATVEKKPVTEAIVDPKEDDAEEEQEEQEVVVEATEDDYDAYELERQRTIRENEALLAQLGLEGFATRTASGVSSPAATSANGASRRSTKRKRGAAAGDGSEDELLLKDGDSGRRSTRSRIATAPAVATRKSSRLLGQTATTPAELAKVEEMQEEARAEAERERKLARKARDVEMELRELVEEEGQDKQWLGLDKLRQVLKEVGDRVNPRSSCQAMEDDADTKPNIIDHTYKILDDAKLAAQRDAREDAKLREAFAKTRLRAHAKVTQERVYCMTIHPEPVSDRPISGGRKPAHGLGLFSRSRLKASCLSAINEGNSECESRMRFNESQLIAYLP